MTDIVGIWTGIEISSNFFSLEMLEDWSNFELDFP